MISKYTKKIDNYVEDFSGVLSEKVKQEYDAKFQQLDDEKQKQVVTVFFPHRQGKELKDIALEIFNENKIGYKGKNDGLLLVVATEEKKIRIMVGKGVEFIYTSLWARNLIEGKLRPLMNSGKYSELLEVWYEAMSQKKVYKNYYNREATVYQPKTKEGEMISKFLFGIFILCIGMLSGGIIVFLHFFTLIGLFVIGASGNNLRNKIDPVYVFIPFIGSVCCVISIFLGSSFYSFFLISLYFFICFLLFPFKKSFFVYIVRVLLIFLSFLFLFIGTELDKCNYQATMSSICEIQSSLKEISKKASSSSSNYHDNDDSYSNSSYDSSSSFDGGGGSSNGGGWGD